MYSALTYDVMKIISHVLETRKFVMAILHWKRGLLCDKNSLVKCKSAEPVGAVGNVKAPETKESLASCPRQNPFPPFSPLIIFFFFFRRWLCLKAASGFERIFSKVLLNETPVKHGCNYEGITAAKT